MRFLPINPTTFLVELADLDTTLALFESLSRDPIDKIEELVPAARTLMIRHAAEANASVLAASLIGRDLSTRNREGARTVEISVTYDGVDLAETAKWLGISTDELIHRHTEAEYTVAFTGFAPGFAYLSAPAAALTVPRRPTPRTRIPAGSVALAGSFSGVYPRESPGGWQIIGRTSLIMFDPAREPAALLSLGDRVRFCRADRKAHTRAVTLQQAAGSQNPGLRILSTKLPAVIEDMGRPGLAAMGVSAAGAVDRRALSIANATVGNPPNAAALEITLGDISFEAECGITVALAGAPAPITLRTSDGLEIAAPHDRQLRLEVGDRISLATPPSGMRSYLAAAGGFDFAHVLNSAATDTLSGIGPAPLKAGDRLPLRARTGVPDVAASPAEPISLPKVDECVVLDILLGPRTDWFTPEAVNLLAAQEWLVTQDSSRIGVRLAGARPLERTRIDELPSEGVVRGAIQVPPSGQPVLFLSDHPLTGGYPVIGSIAPHHLDLAGQLPIGVRVRLRPAVPFAEISIPTSADSL